MDTKPVPSGKGAKIETNEVLADDCVLIVGGGPVGLLTAVVLAFYGIPSVIIERNSNTTRYGSPLLPGKVYQKDQEMISEHESGSQFLRQDGLRWI